MPRRPAIAALLAAALLPASALALPPLHEAFAGYFDLGAILSRTTIEVPEVTALAATHFNTLTHENELKWHRVQREEGTFTFAEADRIIAFAREHGMQLIGHALCWHQQAPDWIFQGPDGEPASPELLLERLRMHINTVVGRYRGIIDIWDVVNEPAHPGWEESERIYRDSPWYRILGPDYIAHAIRFAREANPDIVVLINDYDAWWPAKYPRIIRIIEDLRAAGEDIDALGMQGHWNILSPTAEQFETALRAYRRLGVPIHLTEIDVSLYQWHEREDTFPDGPTDDVLQQQADHFRSLAEVMLRHHDLIDRVSFWGVSDRYSWKNNFPARGRPDHALLFDRDYQPKPILHAFVEAAHAHRAAQPPREP